MQTTATIKKFRFIDRIDSVDDDFKKLNVTFEVKKARDGTIYPFVAVAINSYFPQFVISKKMTLEEMYLVLIRAGAKMKDLNGDSVKLWKLKVPCRFVKGRYKTKKGEFIKLELFFKKGVYLFSYFNDKEFELIDNLVKTNQFDFTIAQRNDNTN